MIRFIRFNLSVLLFFVLFFFTLTCGIRSVCSEENIEKYVSKVHVDRIFGGENKPFAYSFEEVLIEAGIPEELALTIINSGAAEEIVKDYIVSIIDNILYDGEINLVSNEDIVNIVRDNMEYVKDYAEEQGMPITPEMEEDIINSVESNAYRVTQNIPDIKDILNSQERKELEISINVVRFILGDMFKNVAILLIIGICALLIILSSTKFKYFFSVGVPCLLSGLIYIVLCYFIENKLRDLILQHYQIDEEVLDITAKSLLEGFRDQAIIIFLVGILAVLIGICVSLLIDMFKGRKVKEEA